MFKSFISVLKENYSSHTYLSEVLLKNKQTTKTQNQTRAWGQHQLQKAKDSQI